MLFRFLLPLLELHDKLIERNKIVVFYKLELIDEEYEVLKRGVEMGFSLQGNHMMEMGVINVGIYSE